ncbi:TetR family transcriptional regulator [Sphingomonas spermidinifaciens]|uniref:TetR family transcriptional regulator n=1 Tax=Sphingomonas spermidinifaciens TaxID=1141889 RepID=A0A2A4B885_9SPHN|nr:TetR/AcrR family transcriptional regulator [Sphingomonas spermidinifaciens]PCD04297.1 TetR family transcriptional regulator [Sphingomonas spermidinifaciens]
MGRRSDHSREELHALILQAGEALMAETGLAGFSAREVAKRVGYTIGTVHNVFGNVDGLVMAINTQTFAIWAEALRARLADAESDRIAALVRAYFAFARANPLRWSAIYEHRVAADAIPADQAAVRGELTGIVVGEVAAALGRVPDEAVGTLARSLVATVHGHCTFDADGSWAAMGQRDAEAAALARVRESIAAALAR